MDKINALAKYLEISPDEIQVEDGRITPYTEYRTPEGTFTVMDKDESRQAVYDDIENLIDDLGVYGLFTKDFISWIENNALDQDWFEDWFLNDYRIYAEDIESEEDDEYGNRLNRECVEFKVINPEEIVNGKYIGSDDLYEEFARKRVEDIKESGTSFSEEFNWQMGNDQIRYIVKENPNIIDLDAIVDECIDVDGYGHNLAGWDGRTIELDDELYAYKQNEYDERDK